MSLSGVVLVGGYSRRMGTDKATLPWIGGGTLLDHQIDTLVTAGADPVILAGRADQTNPQPEMLWVTDSPVAPGPLGGLLSALEQCSSEYLAVLAVDVPHFPASLFKHWHQTARPGCGWVIQGPNGYEPLATLYPKTALAPLLAGAQRGEYRLQDQLHTLVQTQHLRVWLELLPAENCLSNWNCPQDIR